MPKARRGCCQESIPGSRRFQSRGCLTDCGTACLVTAAPAIFIACDIRLFLWDFLNFPSLRREGWSPRGGEPKSRRLLLSRGVVRVMLRGRVDGLRLPNLNETTLKGNADSRTDIRLKLLEVGAHRLKSRGWESNYNVRGLRIERSQR